MVPAARTLPLDRAGTSWAFVSRPVKPGSCRSDSDWVPAWPAAKNIPHPAWDPWPQLLFHLLGRGEAMARFSVHSSSNTIHARDCLYPRPRR